VAEICPSEYLQQLQEFHILVYICILLYLVAFFPHPSADCISAMLSAMAHWKWTSTPVWKKNFIVSKSIILRERSVRCRPDYWSLIHCKDWDFSPQHQSWLTLEPIQPPVKKITWVSFTGQQSSQSAKLVFHLHSPTHYG
jgi:hypothetical protein